MKSTAASAALVAICIAAASKVAANEVGFYMGGSYGQVSKESDRAEYEAFAGEIHDFFRYTPVDLRDSFDDEGSSFALTVGYRLHRYFAVEAAYTRLGEVAYRAASTGNFPMDAGSMNVNIESETSGFHVSVLGTLPLTRNWEIFGRLGALSATNKLKVVISARGEVFAPIPGPNNSDSFSKSSNDVLAGVGISRRLFEIYDLRLEYQRFFAAGRPETGGEGDLDAVLLGLTVTF